VVLPQAKIGEGGVQSLADDLPAAQFHFVDACWCAVVPDSIPQAVYEKHPQAGNRFKRLLAPLQCNVAWGHDDRGERLAIAVNV
jgi:hypothetical protein